MPATAPGYDQGSAAMFLVRTRSLHQAQQSMPPTPRLRKPGGGDPIPEGQNDDARALQETVKEIPCVVYILCCWQSVIIAGDCGRMVSACVLKSGRRGLPAQTHIQSSAAEFRYGRRWQS